MSAPHDTELEPVLSREFADYRATCIHPEASHEQVTDCQHAFYVGAAFVVHCIAQASVADDEAQLDLIYRSLVAEVNAFTEAITAENDAIAAANKMPYKRMGGGSAVWTPKNRPNRP